MTTMHELRYNTIINKHNRLIQDLETKYISHINALLQQKTLIHLQIQNSLYHQLTKLDINIPSSSHTRTKCKEIFKKQQQIPSTTNSKLPTPPTIFVSNTTHELPKMPSIPLPQSTHTSTNTNITQLPSIINPSIPPIPDIQSFISDPSNSNSNFSNICNVSNISNPSNPLESDEIPVIPLSQIINQNISNPNTAITNNYNHNHNSNNFHNIFQEQTSDRLTESFLKTSNKKTEQHSLYTNMRMNDEIIQYNSNCSDNSKGFICICGDKLREIKSTSFNSKQYAQEYGIVFCDICNQKCKRNKIFYHCDRGKKAKQHTEGFDICKNCAYQQLSVENHNGNDTENVNEINSKKYPKMKFINENIKIKNDKKNNKKQWKEMDNNNNMLLKWKCFYCNYSTDNKRSLDAHILSHNGNIRPWQCLFCGKSFMEREHLIIHSKSHQEQKIFKCSYCEFTTDKKSLFNMHSRAHLGEKPVYCSICQKQYCNKITLQAHIKQQHSNGM